MTHPLPAAIRRTGSKRDDGPAERLTFRREEAPRLADVAEGSRVSLPNGETFAVLDIAPDMTGRPTLVVRSSTHHQTRGPMSASTEQPTAELPTVEVSVESTLAPAAPGTGGFGRVTVTVPLAPKPDSITGGHDVSGLGYALTYGDDAAVTAIEAAAESTGEPFFGVAGVPGVVFKITGKQQSADGRATVFMAIDGGSTLGDQTIRRRQAEDNRAAAERKRAAEKAESERRAKDTARNERFAAVDAAFDAMPRADQLAWLASKAAHLTGTERFIVTNPAAVGLT